jgi:hypothetical protein
MNAIYYECVNERKKIEKKGGGRTYNLVFTNPLLYHLHQHILLQCTHKFLYRK